MEKTFFQSGNKMVRMIKLSLPVIATLFILQSCCCIGRAGSGASKNCNCGDKQQNAVNKKKDIQPASMQPVAVAAASNAKVEKPSTPALQTIEPVLLNRNSDGSKKKLPLGIKGIRSNIIAGPNLSFKSSDEDYGSTDHKHSPGAGVQLGLSMSYAFSEKFAVAPALIFKSNSATETLNYSTPGEPGGSNQEVKSKYSYSYLSAPILAEIKVSDQLTLMAGPEINLLLGATVKTTGYGNTDKEDIKDHSVKTGLGVQAGVKYTIPNSPVGIQLLYDHRLSRLNEKTSEYYPGGGYETPAWKMSGFQLGVTCDICELLKNKQR